MHNDIDEYRREMLECFKSQSMKINDIFLRMNDNMEEFLFECIQISRLFSTLSGKTNSPELRVRFNSRVHKNIDRDINQCISHLCHSLLGRSNPTVSKLNQLNKHFNTSALNSRQSTNGSGGDKDFSIPYQQILDQLQTQSQNVN